MLRKNFISKFQRFYNTKIQKGLHYTKDHEWVSFQGKTALIGITDHAQDLLGDITHVGFDKKVGDLVKVHETLGNVESVKTVSDIYSPVSGKITELNQSLDEEKAGDLNKSPYDTWVVKIEFTQKGDLMTPEQYETYVKEH